MNKRYEYVGENKHSFSDIYTGKTLSHVVRVVNMLLDKRNGGRTSSLMTTFQAKGKILILV